MIRKQDEFITIEDDDDVVPGVIVKDDPINVFSHSGEDNFSEQEMVNPSKNDKIPDKVDHYLGRGEKKNIKPRTLLSPKTKGKTHGNKTSKGVGFPQVEKIVVEREADTILN